MKFRRIHHRKSIVRDQLLVIGKIRDRNSEGALLNRRLFLVNPVLGIIQIAPEVIYYEVTVIRITNHDSRN